MLKRVRKQLLATVALFVLLTVGFALSPNPEPRYAPKRVDNRASPVLRGLDGGTGARDGTAPGDVLDVRRGTVLGKPVDARAQLEREVIDNLARMSVNEAWGSRADMIGIWQVTQNIAGRTQRRDPKGLRAAQRALSPRVTMAQAPRSRRHREWWTRWLRTVKEPIGWPGVSLRGEGPNPWMPDGVGRWRVTVTRAENVYHGRAPQRVCRHAVMAWGCNADRFPHCRDYEIAEARGLSRDLSCRGTVNWYYYR